MLLACSPTGDLARTPGKCPDWELNRPPFGSQAGTQSTGPHQSGLQHLILEETVFVFLCTLLNLGQGIGRFAHILLPVSVVLRGIQRGPIRVWGTNEPCSLFGPGSDEVW